MNTTIAAISVFCIFSSLWGEELIGMYCIDNKGSNSTDVRDFRFGIDFKNDSELIVYKWSKTKVDGTEVGENISIRRGYYRIKEGSIIISEDINGAGESTPIRIEEKSIVLIVGGRESRLIMRE